MHIKLVLPDRGQTTVTSGVIPSPSELIHSRLIFRESFIFFFEVPRFRSMVLSNLLLYSIICNPRLTPKLLSDQGQVNMIQSQANLAFANTMLDDIVIETDSRVFKVAGMLLVLNELSGASRLLATLLYYVFTLQPAI